MEHQHSKISPNGPEKDFGGQEMLNSAEMNWNSTMLLTGPLTLKSAVSERRYISQLRKSAGYESMTRVQTFSTHVKSSYASPQQ